MSLENASLEVKLAVDLIMLLEQHELPPKVVLAALDLVQQDYQHKVEQEHHPT